MCSFTLDENKSVLVLLALTILQSTFKIQRFMHHSLISLFHVSCKTHFELIIIRHTRVLNIKKKSLLNMSVLWFLIIRRSLMKNVYTIWIETIFFFKWKQIQVFTGKLGYEACGTKTTLKHKSKNRYTDNKWHDFSHYSCISHET